MQVLSNSYSKLIEILNGTVSTMCKKDIMHCIMQALFLKTPDNIVLGTDLVPEYTDFKQDGWLEYLSDDCRKITNDFRQQLSTHIMYQENSRKEYVKARSTTVLMATSLSTQVMPDMPPSKTARSLALENSPAAATKLTTPGDCMQQVCANTAMNSTTGQGTSTNNAGSQQDIHTGSHTTCYSCSRLQKQSAAFSKHLVEW
jgi:hypothetical protein